MPSNYFENGVQIVGSLAFGSSLKKSISLMNNGDVIFADRPDDPDLAKESIVWKADGSMTLAMPFTFTDKLTIALGTLTADKQALDVTATWNAAAVAFTLLKANVTDTASAAASFLMDLQVGGVSKFKVDKAGVLTLGTALAVSQGGTGLTAGTSGGILGFTAAGTLASSALLVLNGILLGGGAGATPTATAAPTNGQLLIGSTGAAPVLATLTQGANVTITNGPGSITIASSGVQLGDSPTWTGQHTFSFAGPAIRLSNADSQLFIGSTTDPGWAVLALSLNNEVSLYREGLRDLRLAANVYYDGTRKAIATAVSGLLGIINDELNFLTGASATAGTAITFTEQMSLNASGMTLGAPTGGKKGTGTLNATAVYDDNLLLTDWAFDLYYDGRATKGDPFYKGQRLYSFPETRTITAVERRLPWMPTRETFEAERSVGSMVSRLWFGQEQQQMFLFGLDERLQALEAVHAQ